MTFINQQSSRINENLKCEYRYTIFGNSGGYFECVKELINFTAEKIEFLSCKKIFEVLGSRLTIITFGGGDLCIGGDISKIEVKNYVK